MSAPSSHRRSSSPNTWLYGGIVLSTRWVADPSLVPMWDGTVVEVRPDDQVELLRTGSPHPVLVGVEHRQGRPA